MIIFRFEVIIDRTFPTERTVEFELKGECLYCDSPHKEEIYKHISQRSLKRVVRSLKKGEKKHTLGLVVIRNE